MTDQASPGVSAPAAGGQPAVAQPGNGQPAGQPVQPSGQPAAQQSQPAGQPAQPAGRPAAQPAQDVRVPLNVVTALRDEVQNGKTQISELKQQLQQAMMMQNMAFSQQQSAPGGPQAPVVQQPAQQPAEMFSGLEDDDLISVAEMRQFMKSMKPPDIQGAIQPINQELARIQVHMRDPNYENTIRTYLPEIINVNPAWRTIIENAPNPLVAALAVAQTNPRYQATLQPTGQPAGQPAQQPPDILADLQRIIENAAAPASPASQGGPGAMQGYDRFRPANQGGMNDEDFDREVDRVMGLAR